MLLIYVFIIIIIITILFYFWEQELTMIAPGLTKSCNPPASASPMQGLQVSATVPECLLLLNYNLMADDFSRSVYKILKLWAGGMVQMVVFSHQVWDPKFNHQYRKEKKTWKFFLPLVFYIWCVGFFIVTSSLLLLAC